MPRPRPTRPSDNMTFESTPLVASPWSSEPNMADTLTNVGTIGQAPPMNLPGITELKPETFVQGPTPPVMQGIAEYDEFEDEPETDGFLYNDENIYENSGFLGIAIGKKAKARVKARKAKRVEKRALRKQSKNQALADATAALQNARNISTEAVPPPVSDPMLPAAPILPDSTNYMPSMYNPIDMSLQSDDLISDAPINPQTFASPLAYQQAVQAQALKAKKKEKKNNMLLYAGIGAAALIVIVLILKK